MNQNSVEVQEAGWYRGFQCLATAFCYIGGLLPLGWLATAYALVFRYCLALRDEPGQRLSSISFPFHHDLVTMGIFVLPLFFLPWAVSSGGFSIGAPHFVSFRRFMVLLSIWPMTLIYVLVDPGGLLFDYIFAAD